ncbi:hypothetical protein [Bacillus sp. FSL K6-3431]|uniref:hypothetical protein n=1 Tax=Bacillus sp. FSL K6-3431 TaxID=2921500 RepID=UPI0030F79EB5
MPNNANMLRVKIRYKLIGSDHKKDMNMNTFLELNEEMMAKQAGRNSIIKVFTMGSISVPLE